MSYDFKTLLSRKNTGAAKWEQMYGWNPNVPEDVVPLSVADMELKNPPEVVEGLKTYLDEAILGYTMSYDAYSDAVIDWMDRRHGYKIQKEWIVNTPGIVNAFTAAISAYTKKGEGVIVFKPIYYPMMNAIQITERIEANVPLLNNNGHYEIDFDGFEAAAAKKENTMLLFCSPHNPVGRVWTKEELKKVGDICLKHGLKICSDEIWMDLIMPGYKHTVFATISKEIEDITVVCTAPSKTFNVAGLACSNIIIANEDMRNQFNETLKVMRSSSVNVLGYKACELAYTKSEAWLEELLQVLDTNQKLVHNFFKEKYPKCECPLIEGTYLVWVDFRSFGMDNETLEKFMHEEAMFFTDEGYVFGPEGDGYERINIAAPTWVLERELNRLGEALDKYMS